MMTHDSAGLPASMPHTVAAPIPISGCGGHNATFLAACWLVRFGLGDRDAMALLGEFNQRCQPPWTERELAHKLADARKIVSPTLPNPAGPAPAVRQTWSLEPYRTRWLARRQPTPATSPPLSSDPSDTEPVVHASDPGPVTNPNHQPNLL